MFGRKVRVEKLEEEFKTNKMRNRTVFFDLNIRATDPEEVRARSTELITDVDFQPILSELTQFEDVEFENIFRAGRLKPVKFITKAEREERKGTRYPMLYKLLAVVGLGCLLIALFRDMLYLGIDQMSFLIVAAASLLLSIGFYSIKKVIPMALWLKIAGIYDIESNKSDLRIIISADTLKPDKVVAKKLEEDITELYNVLADKYVTKTKFSPLIVKSKAATAETKIQDTIKSVEVELDKLNSRLSSGEISEDTYKEVKNNLMKRREKLETIQDLVTIFGK